MSGVEPQLDGSRHLVNVLASGAGRPYESLLDLRLVERDLIVDSYHRSTEVPSDAERVAAFSTPAGSEFDFRVEGRISDLIRVGAARAEGRHEHSITNAYCAARC